ncbi:hypothetical protein BKI52_34525 [marine bacterium AO1-C]|nr:hypothetical protein BKI52_34525 [marine bacterium AO1-C]
MKKIALTLVLIACFLKTYTQSKTIDSLQQVLIKASSHKQEIQILNKIGLAYVKNQPKDGIGYAQKALRLSQQHRLPLEVAQSHVTLATLQIDLQHLDKALVSIKAALRIYQQHQALSGQTECYHLLGYRLSLLGKESQAIQQYQKALVCNAKEGKQDLTTKQRKDNRLMKAQLWNNIGISYDFMGNLSNASKYYRKSLEYYKKYGTPKQQLSGYGNLGQLYTAMGKMEIALSYNQKALKLAQKINDQYAQSVLSNNRGIIFEKQGEYSEALRLYQDALDMGKQVQNDEMITDALNNMGHLYLAKKKYQEAQKHYNQALTIAQKTKNKRLEMDILISLAYLKYVMKAYRESEKTYQRILSQFEDANLDPYKGGILRHLGDIYLDQAKYNQALKKYTSSYNSFVKTQFQEQLAASANSLAQAYFKINQLDSSQKYTLITKKIAQTIQSKGMLRKSYFNQYRLDSIQQNYLRAFTHYQQYQALSDSLDKESDQRRLEVLRIKYHLKEKEQALQLKNQEAALLAQKNKNSRQVIMWLIIGGSLAILLIGWQMSTRGKSAKIKEAQKRLLQEQLHRKRLEEQVLQDRLEADESEKQNLQKTLEQQNHELTKQALYMVQKRELLQTIKQETETIKEAPKDYVVDKLSKITKRIDQELNKNEEWEKFTQTFEMAHPEFYIKLKKAYPSLTANETKLCALLRLNFNTKELALILNITPESANKARSRLRKKLDLGNVNLNEYLINF